ncbi:polyketide synthase dehydratase domain-containing protein, partial [Bacillus wiedmannii]|uniref:polyketide synthase dehydratase domain-containing protein n=1 Tax=Bacillus wiedmannii TaxID=1890302 RepID=UPI003529F2AA
MRAQCSHREISALECYEIFRSVGLNYGPAHQGIERLYVGEGQVLAKLLLPSVVADTLRQFVLHPGLMDSALQASIGLLMESTPLKPALPFALQEVDILGQCTSEMWALVRYSKGSKPGDRVQKLDID